MQRRVNEFAIFHGFSMAFHSCGKKDTGAGQRLQAETRDMTICQRSGLGQHRCTRPH